MKLLNTPYGLSLTQERRHGRRRKVDSVFYVNIDPDNGGVLLDLSEGGMCISVANPLILSSEIRFTVRLDDNRPIEGRAKVSWLSESGKSAGVQFSYLSNESRMRLRQYLAGTDELTRNAATVETNVPAAGTATRETRSSFGAQASAQAETETSSGSAWRPSEGGEKHTEPQTPLFFLPKKPASDEIHEEVTWQPEPYTWHPERPGTENEGETVEAFRSAIISNPEQDEETSPEERRSNKTLIALTVCFLMLAGGAAAIVAYPKQFSQLRQFTASFAASLTAPSEPAPVAPSEPVRPERRTRRRAARRPMFVAKGPQRGSHPVGDSTIFDAPRDSSTGFQAATTDSSNRRWLASASGRRLVPDGAPASTPAASPDSTSYSGGGTPVASNPQAPTSTTIATPQPSEQMGGLRVDGGFLDEGSVSPTFAPLNLDGQTLSATPIVVQAVVGKNGGVESARLVSAPSSQLAEAIVAAVKRWRYQPLYRDGQPIEFVTRITFNFSLPNANER